MIIKGEDHEIYKNNYTIIIREPYLFLAQHLLKKGEDMHQFQGVFLHYNPNQMRAHLILPSQLEQVQLFQMVQY